MTIQTERDPIAQEILEQCSKEYEEQPPKIRQRLGKLEQQMLQVLEVLRMQKCAFIGHEILEPRKGKP